VDGDGVQRKAEPLDQAFARIAAANCKKARSFGTAILKTDYGGVA
jgi:hypothetical protein